MVKTESKVLIKSVPVIFTVAVVIALMIASTGDNELSSMNQAGSLNYPD